jgi:parvulin-like peptidyl-prolyl isomerase
MPAMKLSDLSANIRKEISPLAVGQVSKPIKVAGNFHIFKLEEKTFSGSDDYARSKRKLEFELRSLEIFDQTQKWIVDQRRRSKIIIM